MVVHGNNYSGFDRLIEQAEQQKAEHLKEHLSKSQWVAHSYDAASDWLDENPINADDVRLKALSQMSMPATEVVISWPRLTGRAKALADLVITYISRSAEQTYTEIVKPRKRAFHGYAPVPLSYFDDSECAKKIVTDEVKRQKDAAESEVLECCINSLPSRNASRELEPADTNLTERCLAYAKQRKERFFANKQALAQQGTMMSKEAVLESIEEVIKAFSEERARERRILERAKKRLERNDPLTEEDKVLMATWSGELLQEPPELLHTQASISSPLGVTSLVDTCNRKPQAALNAALAVAYGAAVKPVFPVTEAEHRSSLKNLVRSAAKTKGRK